jgi:hypothetical protein
MPFACKISSFSSILHGSKSHIPKAVMLAGKVTAGVRRMNAVKERREDV